MDRVSIAYLISALMAGVMLAAVFYAVFVLFGIEIQCDVNIDKDLIRTMFLTNSTTSLPPFVLNGSVVMVKNGTVNITAIGRPSGFLIIANGDFNLEDNNMRVLVFRQGNWTDIAWNSYPVLMENLFNMSHNGTNCHTFQVPDAPIGCIFEEEWHDMCPYPRLRCNCSTREVFSYCGSECGDDRNRILCPVSCNQGCFCAPGHRRDATGHCVDERARSATIDCPVYKLVQPPANCSYVPVPQDDGCYIHELRCNESTCSTNMTWTDCGSHCPYTCGMNPDEAVCSLTDQCRAGCTCKVNYWFNPLSGSCVDQRDCPTRVALDPSCTYPELPDAPNGCYYEDQVQSNSCPMPTLRCNSTEYGQNDCPFAFVSSAPQSCWYEKHVDSLGCSFPVVRCTQQCAANEVYQNCSSTCEPTCDNQSPVCTLMCMPPKCQCKSGYVRDNLNGCIPALQCPMVDPCLSMPCHANQTCVKDPKQCLLPPCPQFKCIDLSQDKNLCGMMSEEPLQDAAGNYLNCSSCSNSNYFCLHLSDKQVCCPKTDSVAASTRLFAELTSLMNNTNIAVKGEALNKIITSIKATRWNNTTSQLANFLIIHVEPALALDDYEVSHDMEAAFVAACRPLTTMGCTLKGGIKTLFASSIGDAQVTVDTSDVLLECADGGPLPIGEVSIVFDFDPFYALNRNSCTVLSFDIKVADQISESHMNVTDHQLCDVVPDYGVHGFNAYLRSNSRIMTFNPIFHSAPAFEPTNSFVEESFALKLFALREHAKSQAISCTQDNLEILTAENVTGDPIELIYDAFAHTNQTTVFTPENLIYYEMVGNFSDYFMQRVVCGANREYLNIANHMTCSNKKALRLFLSAQFNDWKQEEVDLMRQKMLQQPHRSSMSSNRFYVKTITADPPAERTPNNLSTAELCSELALKNFFENDWIGTTVPNAWVSILDQKTTDQEQSSKMKKKPEKVPISNDDYMSANEVHCTNKTVDELRHKVSSSSISGETCGKDEQLPHFLWTKDDVGNIYQGYQLTTGQFVWHQRATCACNRCAMEKQNNRYGNRGESESNFDNFPSEENHSFDNFDVDEHSKTTAATGQASYLDCISSILKKNGYKEARINFQQLVEMAATADKSLVKSIVSQVSETCGKPPSGFLQLLQKQQ